jgi:hypothetical protein
MVAPRLTKVQLVVAPRVLAKIGPPIETVEAPRVLAEIGLSMVTMDEV